MGKRVHPVEDVQPQQLLRSKSFGALQSLELLGPRMFAHFVVTLRPTGPLFML